MSKDVKQTIFVNGVVHNAKQQVLLVQRSSKDDFLPGYFELPGGRVEPGETLEHALKRKLVREVNLEMADALYYMSIAQLDRNGPYTRLIFEVACSDPDTVTLTKAHDSFIWVGREDLKKYTVASDARAVVESYLGSAPTTKGSDGKKTTHTIFTDGGSRGNPGPSASAYVIYDESGDVVEKNGEYIGITTNNQAEYTAVLLALQGASKLNDVPNTITLNIDSLLVVNQMNGIYKVKNRELWPLHQKIREAMKQFQAVYFKHVPREDNTVADAKVNEILDAHAGASNKES